MRTEISVKTEESIKLTITEKKILTFETKEAQNKIVREAFTLLELLVVIAILGMLAAFVVPAVTGKKDEAQRNITCTQMASIEKQLEEFHMHNGVYPETEEGLEALLSNPNKDTYPQYPKNPYYKKLPMDSWGKPFNYIKLEDDGFKVISFAADRKEGGEGNGADIFYPGCEKK